MFIQSSLLAFLWLLFRLLCIHINSRDIHGRWDFALVLQCGMVLFISIVRLSRKKIPFVLTSCEFGSVPGTHISRRYYSGVRQNAL